MTQDIHFVKHVANVMQYMAFAAEYMGFPHNKCSPPRLAGVGFLRSAVECATLLLHVPEEMFAVAQIIAQATGRPRPFGHKRSVCGPCMGQQALLSMTMSNPVWTF